MAILENWGTSGTAGVLGWKFSGAAASIGTVGGTACLQHTTGSHWLPFTYTYDATGSYHANIYLAPTGQNTQGWYIKLSENTTTGTSYWVQAIRTITGVYDRIYLHWYERYDGTWSDISGTYGDTLTIGATSWHDLSITYAGTEFTGTITGGTVDLVSKFAAVEPITIVPTCAVHVNAQADRLDYLDLPFSRITILDFTGTYNDGSDTGTYNLGDDVLTMSGVTELGFMPYMNAGWAATIPVSIDDSTGVWAGLAGSMNNPTFLDGTYTIRHKWNSVWHILRTCYAEAEDIKYDYGKKIASVTLHDILGKRADETLPLAGTLSTDLCENLELGTVIAVDADTRTFTFKNNLQDYTTNSGPWYGKDDILWNSTGSMGSRISVGSALSYDQYGAGTWLDQGNGWKNGSIALSGTVPDWITADAVIRITERFPTRGQIVDYAAYQTSDWFDLVLDAWGFDDVSSSEKKPMNYYDLKPAKVYHPGDKYKDILNDLCVCCQTSYSLDGSGAMSFYTDGIFSGSNYGTFDFNSLPLNNNWTVSYISATKQVRIKAAWDNEDGKYTVEYLSEEGTFESGQTLNLECPWLRDDVNAEHLADRIAFFRNVTRMALSFEIEGSEWLNYAPRYKYTIANLPAAVLVPSSTFRLMGKTYQLNGYTALTFESEKPGTSWFTWNQSKWDGTDVWW